MSHDPEKNGEEQVGNLVEGKFALLAKPDPLLEELHVVRRSVVIPRVSTYRAVQICGATSVAATVPEPGTALLVGAGLLGLMGFKRSKRRGASVI